MIREEVNELFDEDIHEENNVEIAERREEMLGLMRDPEWIAAALGGEE